MRKGSFGRTEYDLRDFKKDELVFSADGRMAAGFYVSRHRADSFDDDTDYEIKVWDYRTGGELACFSRSYDRGHAGSSGAAVDSVEFSPDGRKLLINFEGGGQEAEDIPGGGVRAGDPVAPAESPTLVLLTLRGNRIGPELAQALAGSDELAKVTELDLTGNEIGDAGAAALAESLELSRLEALRLSESDAGPKGLAALRGRFAEQLIITPKPGPIEGRCWWTVEEYMACAKRVARELEEKRCTVALEYRDGGQPAVMVIYLPGAKLIPRDPATSFEIRPAKAKQGEGISIEGLYLECAKKLEEIARPILGRVLEQMLLARRNA